MRLSTTLILAGMVIAVGSSSALANTPSKQCRAESGKHRVTLVELYTSEGCSSCPPADTWLRELPKSGFGPNKVVPLAFHVDYWDYIGWADRFAKPSHTLRQRDIARANKLRTIYTPQVVLNGRDFRHWYWGKQAIRTIEKNSLEPAKAKISLSVRDISNIQLRLRGKFAVAPQSYPSRASAYIALYQNNQSSAVKRGENTGRKLKHDYVVRDLLGPYAIHSDGMLEINKTITLSPSWKHTDMGVAAFIQNHTNGEVLQALSLPMCKKK